MNVFIVTVVDNGGTNDGRARVLGTFKTMEDAQNYVKNDIAYVTDVVETQNGEVVSKSSMDLVFINVSGEEFTSLYNIEEIEIDASLYNIKEIEIDVN